MTDEHLQELLKEGEGLTIEFKENKGALNNSVFETVSSFSNRYGGHILLGVEDDSTVIGVTLGAVSNMKKNFVNMLNNPEMISPSLYLSLEEIEIDGKLVLYTYIPINSQVVLCKGSIYDRIEDSDTNITKVTDLVAHLYNRKSSLFTEREVFPYVTLDDLRLDLIPRVKQMALSRNPNHSWEHMDNMEFFRSAGLYDDDKRSGKRGFNLAAILLFGRDEVIQSCAPGYVTDALLRRENLDRYDDRLMVETNLIDAYDQLVDFIGKHTLDRFFLIDDQNVSVRTWIAREVVSNTLVHREYASTFPAKVIIDKDHLYVENWNKSNLHGRINPNDFTPQPKNPILARFFVNIGRADKLGSGVRNLYKFTKIYSGGEPELIEGDVFKTIVPLTRESYEEVTGSRGADTANGAAGDTANDDATVNATVNATVTQVLDAIREDNTISYNGLAQKLSKERTTIYRHIKTLKDAGILERIGSDKTGHWQINDDSSDQ